MTRRGEELREHILWTAKEVFLERGFERTSMDLVAERVGTSKRTLYAHFENKEHLFHAIIDFMRDLYLEHIRTPAEVTVLAGESLKSEEVSIEEVIVRYCGRTLQLLLWERWIRALRMVIAESDQSPEAAERFHSAIFGETEHRLATFIEERLGLASGHDLSERLLQLTVYPSIVAALFGVEPSRADHPDEQDLAKDVDLAQIRVVVASLLPDNTAAPS